MDTDRTDVRPEPPVTACRSSSEDRLPGCQTSWRRQNVTLRAQPGLFPPWLIAGRARWCYLSRSCRCLRRWIWIATGQPRALPAIAGTAEDLKVIRSRSTSEREGDDVIEL